MWETLRSWFYSPFPIQRDVTRVSVVIWYISLQILGKQINNEYNITNDDLQIVWKYETLLNHFNFSIYI